MIVALIVALAVTGLVISLYFALAYYGRVKKARWVPEILCAGEGSRCVAVVRTPHARLFGVPNSLLGSVYYAAILGWVVDDITGWISDECLRSVDLRLGTLQLHFSGPVHLALVFVSLGAVVFGFYLIHALRRVLRADCPLCYTAHAINVALFVLLCVKR